MFRFLADAKLDVPFFSGRYIGHINTDLLLPGLLGYFASMLYNQNNVAGESSPMTARLEQEVVAMLAGMVGFATTGDARASRTTGYLTSGGTTANIYALWVARNLRTWPIALRLTIDSALADPSATKDQRRTADILRDMSVLGADGSKIQLADTSVSVWDLWNLPVREGTCRLRKLAKILLEQSGDPAFQSEQCHRAIDEFVEPWTLASPRAGSD